MHAQQPPRSLPPSHKKTSKARRIFKIDLKTGPTKKDKTKFIQNEIGATSLLEKKLEQPPADRICSDLDLGPDFVAEFKTGFKTGFQLDQSSRAASHTLLCEAVRRCKRPMVPFVGQ